MAELWLELERLGKNKYRLSEIIMKRKIKRFTRNGTGKSRGEMLK